VSRRRHAPRTIDGTDLTSLIVNADDFGACEGVNRGIVEAHERGIVTSTSLMVNRPSAEQAAAYGRRRPELGVGLHVELRDWRVRGIPWSRASSEEKLQSTVTRDAHAQLERFRRLLGRDPTHIDSHQHRHRIASLRPIFEAMTRDLGIPLRHFDPRVQFCGEFYGHDGAGRPDPEAITPTALVRLLEELPSGSVELGCHPGYTEGLREWYREERVQEVRSLCDPQVRAALDRLGITLISFADLGARPDSQAASDVTPSLPSP
jgi:predicted glycoside hydrolase/deacetylase ChbG (UPF0249 family)